MMRPKQKLIVLYTLIRKELVRMFRIASQVFLPSVITTALYFLIFGTLIGKRIGTISGLPYPLFIAPGLIMMSIISNSYGNVSTSLFGARFQKNIEEVLVSPISNTLLLLGYILAGMLRGLIVASLVFIVAYFFVDLTPYHPLLTIFIVLLVAAIFSLLGFTNALYARTFDDIMLVPTFILTPLTYLGGVFYSSTMLAPLWATLTHINPIFYMINALRYSLIGYSEVSFINSAIMLVAVLLGLIALNYRLLQKGVGLRDMK